MSINFNPGNKTISTKKDDKARSFAWQAGVLDDKKPERSTIFWLAPKLDYLPVKVSHIDGKTSYGLLLTSYTGKTN